MIAQTMNPFQERADCFLKIVNSCYQALTVVSQEAQWRAVTDVQALNDAASETAQKALAAFNGNSALIGEVREFLKHTANLSTVTILQLQRMLFNAADGPMSNRQLTQARIAAETQQASIQNGFIFKLDGEAISTNRINEILATSSDLVERQKIWALSKDLGPALKGGLITLRDLRNSCAQELGYSDFYALQAARYGMSTEEMLQLHRNFLSILRPLYLQLHTWAKYELARKYKQPVPKTIPAHWISNRWSQEWTNLVEGIDFNLYFKSWSAEKITQTAEDFFVGLGFPRLPATFWTKSDLYPLKPGESRKKNSHAWCWHLDLDQDIRSLMSVEPNFDWFQTVHHEFGHAYYFLSFAHPDVPPLLRDSATPAFHEGMAELVSLATRQLPYLRSIGLLPADYKADQMQVLLAEALETAIPFMFWGSGTMNEWEAEFYAKGMPAQQMNTRWWKLVKEFQGVQPPSPRSEMFCDPATKTHINDAPAYYFNYPIAFVLKYQFHDYICRNILKQDPHEANYAGNRQVGDWLRSWLKLGATKEWRQLLKEATGEELSTRAMMEYFQPLMAWIQVQNRDRQIGWE